MLISKKATISFTADDIKKLIQQHIQQEANMACDLKDIRINIQAQFDYRGDSAGHIVSADAEVKLN